MDDLEYLYYRLDVPYEDDEGNEEQHLFPFSALLDAEMASFYREYVHPISHGESPDWVIDIW
jgi:hypothetical protein